MSNEDDIFREILDEDVTAHDEKGGLSVGMKNAARQTAPWMKFIAVMLFIYGGFLILGLLFSMATVFFSFSFRILIQLVMAGLYIFLGSVLFKAGTELSLFADLGSARKLEDAMENQLKFWKTSGILTIVGIGIIVITFLLVGGYGLLR